jgi:hypothetical protein
MANYFSQFKGWSNKLNNYISKRINGMEKNYEEKLDDGCTFGEVEETEEEVALRAEEER